MQNTPLQSHPLSAKHALRDAARLLAQAGIGTASLDARILLQHILNVSHERWLADESLALTPRQEADYRELVQKRRFRQPVAQLTGRREFYGREFKVTEATLDPRPDSETLIEAVLEWVAGHKSRVMGKEKLPMTHDQRPMTILDLGTGTGCLLLTCLSEMKNAEGVGADISEDALGVARHNAERLGLQDRATFVQSNWNENIKGMFDIIIANPPYIPTDDIASLAPEVSRFEPKLALDGGADGLAAYRAIAAPLPGMLKEGGIAAFEIGQGQEEDVRKIVVSCKLQVLGVKRDLGEIPRCVLIQHAQLKTYNP